MARVEDGMARVADADKVRDALAALDARVARLEAGLAEVRGAWADTPTTSPLSKVFRETYAARAAASSPPSPGPVPRPPVPKIPPNIITRDGWRPIPDLPPLYEEPPVPVPRCIRVPILTAPVVTDDSGRETPPARMLERVARLEAELERLRAAGLRVDRCVGRYWAETYGVDVADHRRRTAGAVADNAAESLCDLRATLDAILNGDDNP